MKNSQQADNHVLRNDEALIGWYWTGGSTTSKDTWRAGARSPNPYPFLFYFIFNFKVGFNAKLLIIKVHCLLGIEFWFRELEMGRDGVWDRSCDG